MWISTKTLVLATGNIQVGFIFSSIIYLLFLYLFYFVFLLGNRGRIFHFIIVFLD